MSSKLDYLNLNSESKSRCSNGTPKSLTKIDRNSTEYSYRSMTHIDFPMRVNYCWDFSESHRNFFNNFYIKKFCCNVCGTQPVSVYKRLYF